MFYADRLPYAILLIAIVEIQLIKTVLIAFIVPGDTGYLQYEFAAQCTNCSFVITREVLAVVKFVHDFTLEPDNSEDADVYGDGVYMA